MVDDILKEFKALSTRGEAESLIAKYLPDVSDKVCGFKDRTNVYVSGTHGDFQELTAQIAENFPSEISGVACVWTHECEFERRPTSPDFVINQRYVEAPKTSASLVDNNRDELLVVFCQTILSDAYESKIAILAMRGKVEIKEVIVVCLLANKDVVQELIAGLYLEGIYSKVYPIAETTIDLRPLTRKLFNALDDRVSKPGPLISDWLIDRIAGSRSTPTPIPPFTPRPPLTPQPQYAEQQKAYRYQNG